MVPRRRRSDAPAQLGEILSVNLSLFYHVSMTFFEFLNGNVRTFHKLVAGSIAKGTPLSCRLLGSAHFLKRGCVVEETTGLSQAPLW